MCAQLAGTVQVRCDCRFKLLRCGVDCFCPPLNRRFRIEGMTCSSCSGAVESTLAGLPGVAHAAVSLTLQASHTWAGEAGQGGWGLPLAGPLLSRESKSTAAEVCVYSMHSAALDCSAPAVQEAKVEFDPQLLDEVRVLYGIYLSASCLAAALGCCKYDGIVRHTLACSLRRCKPHPHAAPAHPPVCRPRRQAQLAAAIQDCGFACSSLGSGEAATLLLSVSGMVCASCSSAVEAALRGTQGVLEASVSLLTSKAEVRLLCCFWLVGLGRARLRWRWQN